MEVHRSEVPGPELDTGEHDTGEPDTGEHDTIDLEDELGDIDAMLAADALAESRRVGIVEFVLVAIANVVWAVVGLVLWLPQAFRAVVGAALRVIHSALTHQRSDRAVAGINRVSRLYFDRFLRRRSDPVFVGRRHELRPFRLIVEIAWVAAFYLLLLRWLAPSAFRPAWARLVGWGSLVRQQGAAGVDWLRGLSPPDLSGLAGATWQVAAALVGVAALAALAGFWLGRR